MGADIHPSGRKSEIGLRNLEGEAGAKLAKADVKRAYRAGIIANHPDKGGNEEKAKAIIAAFKFLEPFLT
jgi:hypothetical protein